MKKIIYLLLSLFFLVSCEQQLTIEQQDIDQLQGKWIMVDYPQFSFTMKDSTIEQVGFPLVTRTDLKYKKVGNKYNMVTTTSTTADNYAAFSVLSLGLPSNQSVYCTLKYKGDCKNAFIQIITDINGKDKYEQIRLNNTKDGFSFIHFPVFSNLKTLRVLTEFDKIGQDFEFETPKFSYL